MGWCSLHIFYYTGQDDLLLECIAPLARALRDEGLVSQLFFLRYWKDGPHIRLRLCTPNDQARDRVLGIASDRIAAYLADHPSPGTLDDKVYGNLQSLFSTMENMQVTEVKLAANNTFRVEPYIPEYTKYGGPRGVAIAEQLFDRSTQSVFTLLPELRANPGKRLAIAFTMTLLGMVQFGVAVEDIPEQLDYYCRYWSRDYYADLVQAGERRLDKQIDSLSERARAIIMGDGSLPSAYRHWSDTMRATAEVLDANADEVLGAVTLLDSQLPPERRREFLLMHYLHTNNNRLGIHPGDEAYLSFLGERVMRRLVEERALDCAHLRRNS